MSRFFWLIRREIWEHKAIWVAPLIVIGCLLLAVITGNVHLGPIRGDGRIDAIRRVAARKSRPSCCWSSISASRSSSYLVMGVIAFFYALDSLYADRRDRSVLFWKSLPLSDAETVLSKFTIAIVVIPLVALIGSLVAQLMVAGGGSVMLAMSGVPGAHDVAARCDDWRRDRRGRGRGTAILWYAPLVAYLMLASAWAPKGPFLWAVLPPVALSVFEKVVIGTNHIGTFVADRIKGPLRLLDSGMQTDADGTKLHLSQLDLAAGLRDFYSSPELWLGVVAAGLLLAAAMWVRRYRDETT